MDLTSRGGSAVLQHARGGPGRAGVRRKLDSGPCDDKVERGTSTMSYEVFERDGECASRSAEIPGQMVRAEQRKARTSLADAMSLILEDRREDGLRGVPADVNAKTYRR